MKKLKLDRLLISIMIPLATAQVSALFSQNSRELYDTFAKPAYSPPGYVFPIIWTLLYILMGISFYMIFSDTPESKNAVRIYFIQLLFNFGWSIFFFGFGLYLYALIWLIILIIMILIMIYKFYQVKPIAAYLQIPYLLWCIYAAYLNYGIYILYKK